MPVQTNKKKIIGRPKGARGEETYKKLLQAAQDIIVEQGPDAINTNAIASKAGFTPPVFYRHFKDKYALLITLCENLMEAQNNLVVVEISQMGLDPDSVTNFVRNLFETHIKTTREYTAGFELMLLMRANPELKPIRLGSHIQMTQIMSGALSDAMPDVPKQVLSARIRVVIEIFYSTLEMLYETDFADQDIVIDACSSAITSIYGI